MLPERREREAGGMNAELRFPDEFVSAIADAVEARLAGADGDAGPEDGWRLLTVGEVAKLVGRSPRWVHDAVTNRGLPFVRLDGGGRMFDLEDVRAWVRARRVPAVDS